MELHELKSSRFPLNSGMRIILLLVKSKSPKPKYSQDLDASRIAHLVQHCRLTLDLVEQVCVSLDRQLHLFLKLGGLDYRLDQLILLDIF